MNPETGRLFLAALGVKNVSLKDGDWLIGSCPLAPWLHKSGHDHSPSFGLHVDPSQSPHFHCFSCRSGSTSTLLSLIQFHASRSGSLQFYDLKTARLIEENDEIEVLPLPEYQEFGQTSSQVFQEWPQYFVDSFVQADAHGPAMDYLIKRGITHKQIHDHNLRFDTHRQMVVFPFHNVFGKLAGARGRSIKENVAGHEKHYDYKWNKVSNTKLVWYNEPVLQTTEPVVVVEGQIDALLVEQVYPVVVANMTARPSEQKLKRLSQSAGVVLIPDNDETGKAAVELYSRYCDGGNLPLAVIDLDEAPRLDGKSGSPKDPAEVDQDWLRDRLLELSLPV